MRQCLWNAFCHPWYIVSIREMLDVNVPPPPGLVPSSTLSVIASHGLDGLEYLSVTRALSVTLRSLHMQFPTLEPGIPTPLPCWWLCVLQVSVSVPLLTHSEGERAILRGCLPTPYSARCGNSPSVCRSVSVPLCVLSTSPRAIEWALHKYWQNSWVKRMDGGWVTTPATADWASQDGLWKLARPGVLCSRAMCLLG